MAASVLFLACWTSCVLRASGSRRLVTTFVWRSTVASRSITSARLNAPAPTLSSLVRLSSAPATTRQLSPLSGPRSPRREISGIEFAAASLKQNHRSDLFGKLEQPSRDYLYWRLLAAKAAPTS